MRSPTRFAAVLILAPLALAGCSTKSDNTVTLYCSVDDVFAKPIIADLEKRTGLRIQPLFDVESAKTAGLANKLRAEKQRPRADVFWASTTLQTEMMANEGLLARYVPKGAADVPPAFKDPDGRWTAVGVRARVMIAGDPNLTRPLSYVPASAPGTLAISNPQFGTASDWCAAYASRWGKDRALAYFKKLKAADVRVLPGNADVALGVADGHIQLGITDSDDFLSQLREKKKVYLVKTTADNVLVPGCASMVEGAPHPENARKLMDTLVDAQTEAELVKGMPGVFSVRHLNEDSNWKAGGQDFSFLKTNGRTDAYSEWRPAWESIRAPLADILTP